jgi:hypothetical protein
MRRDPNLNDPNTTDPAASAMGWGLGWWWLLWCFLIIIFFFGGWGWGGWWGGPWWGGYRNPNQQTTAPPVQAPAPPANTDRAPPELANREATITGQVDRVVGPHAFTLKPPATGGKDLLVVLPKNAQQANVKEGKTVSVTGKIENFDWAEFKKQTGLDLPQDRFSAYEGQVALLANKTEEKH